MKQAIIILLLASPLYAKPYATVGLGPITANDHMYSSTLYSGEFGFKFHGVYTSIEGSIINQAAKAGAFHEGTITMVPVFLNLGGNIPISKRWRINTGMGLGYIQATKDIKPETVYLYNLSGEDLKEEIDPNMAWRVRGGLSYKLTQRVNINLTVGHVFFDTQAHEIRKNKFSLNRYDRVSDVDLNYTYGVLGLEVVF